MRRDHRRADADQPLIATTVEPTTTPLDALSAETAALSAALIDNSGQREALERIEDLWAGLRPEIADNGPTCSRASTP